MNIKRDTDTRHDLDILFIVVGYTVQSDGTVSDADVMNVGRFGFGVVMSDTEIESAAFDDYSTAEKMADLIRAAMAIKEPESTDVTLDVQVDQVYRRDFVQCVRDGGDIRYYVLVSDDDCDDDEPLPRFPTFIGEF